MPRPGIPDSRILDACQREQVADISRLYPRENICIVEPKAIVTPDAPPHHTPGMRRYRTRDM
jgi:hypothetical protein